MRIIITTSLIVLLACGSEAREAPASGITPATSTDEAATASSDPERSSEPERTSDDELAPTLELAPAPGPRAAVLPLPEAPVTDLGLPAVVPGPPIRLPMLPVTEQRVGDRSLPSVALADEASRARLDTLIDEIRFGDRCRVVLAIESLVSLRCTFRGSENEGGNTEHVSYHFRVGAAGDVAAIQPGEVFVQGTDLDRWIPFWLNSAQDRGPAGDVALTASGLEISQLGMGGDEGPIRLPWRYIAPWVRADGPLGPALIAAGAVVAAAGTQAPAPPPRGPATVAERAGPLLLHWMGLPPEWRPSVRFIAAPDAADYGDRPYALVFPPGTPLESLPLDRRPTAQAFYAPTASEIVLARTTRPVEVRERVGPRAAVTGRAPKGAVVAAVRGLFDDRLLGVGDAGWVFVASSTAQGWVPGRSLTMDGACDLEWPPLEGASVELRGTAELSRAGARTPIAWFTARPRGERATHLLVHSLDGCSVGAGLRRVATEGVFHDLLFSTTAARDGDSMIAVVTQMSATRWRLAVFGLDGDAPIYTRDGPIEVSGPERRGPRNERGHFPFVITEGEDRVWLAWNGAALEELRAE